MNEYFAQTLAQVLEETSTNMGNAMILDHLAKKGTVSIEEAEFYHNLCADVITEAAEDFIPDTLDVPEAPEAPEAMAPMELYDAVGNKYIFQDGDLIPVDGDEDGMNPEDEGIPAEAPAEVPAPEVAPVAPTVNPEEQYTEGSEIATTVLNDNATTPIAGVTTAEDTSGEGTVGTVLESEEVAPEADAEEVVEESTVIADEAPALLEESDNVVARILANLR